MWLTVDETAELLDTSVRTIQRTIDKYTTKVVTNEKGTKKFLININSLPVEVQKDYYMSDEYITSTCEDDQERELKYTLAELKELHGNKFEQHMDKALFKQQVILQVKALKHGGKGEAIAAICSQYDINEKSIRRWTADYKEYGFVGLLRKPKKKVGSTKLEEEAISFIRGCYLQPIRPVASQVYKLYTQKAKQEGWNEASYDTVLREIKRIPFNELVYTRYGEKAYNAQCMPKITRDYTDLLINEYWVGDGHTLAIWTPSEGKIIRYTMSAWMDMRSRAMVGWCLAKHSSSEVIAAALRSGIIRYGLPGSCYMDNGKDYRSQYLNAGMAGTRYKFLEDYEGVFKSFEINAKFATPFFAWAKPIERYFRTFSSNLSRYITGFCGESITEKPHDLKKDEIFIKGIDIETVAKLIEGYHDAYNNTPHRSLGGKTPMQVIEEIEFYRHDMPTEEELDILMLKVGKRKISPSGIQMFNSWYWHDDMVLYNKQECIVRYDPNNIGELYVYIDGVLKFKARSKELLSMNASEEDIREWRKLQARARRATKEAIDAYNIDQDEVRRLVLSQYVDEETIDMIVPTNKKAVDNPKKVVRMNRNTKLGKKKAEFDNEYDTSEAYGYFEAIGDEYLKQIK